VVGFLKYLVPVGASQRRDGYCVGRYQHARGEGPGSLRPGNSVLLSSVLGQKKRGLFRGLEPGGAGFSNFLHFFCPYNTRMVKRCIWPKGTFLVFSEY
jgi:hypothetical protein